MGPWDDFWYLWENNINWEISICLQKKTTIQQKVIFLHFLQPQIKTNNICTSKDKEKLKDSEWKRTDDNHSPNGRYKSYNIIFAVFSGDDLWDFSKRT